MRAPIAIRNSAFQILPIRQGLPQPERLLKLNEIVVLSGQPYYSSGKMLSLSWNPTRTATPLWATT